MSVVEHNDPAATPVPNGTETVLVVEDDEAVRRLIRVILERAGYTVLEAGCGSAALDVSGAHEGAIDLLMTDLNLPDMSGRELATRVRMSRSEMKLLYMSGYGARAIEDYGILPGGRLFLPKPFTPYGLLWKVREAVDGYSGEAPSGA